MSADYTTGPLGDYTFEWVKCYHCQHVVQMYWPIDNAVPANDLPPCPECSQKEYLAPVPDDTELDAAELN